MWSVEIDKVQQKLLIKFCGRVGPEEAKACADKLRGLLDSLEPGFVLVSDLSELESMGTDCSPFIDRVMDDCNRKGVRKVIRVIPDAHKDIGFGIMSLFHYGHEVRVITVKTLAEAEKKLTGLRSN
jgi:hypothetical protein